VAGVGAVTAIANRRRVHGGPDAQGPVRWDFSTCANAAGPCPQALAAIRWAAPTRYPDPAGTAVRQALTGVPLLGMLPMKRDHGLPEEDGLYSPQAGPAGGPPAARAWPSSPARTSATSTSSSRSPPVAAVLAGMCGFDPGRARIVVTHGGWLSAARWWTGQGERPPTAADWPAPPKPATLTRLAWRCRETPGQQRMQAR
jgi:hypothetical protein